MFIYNEKVVNRFSCVFFFVICFSSQLYAAENSQQGIKYVGKVALGQKNLDLKIANRRFSPSFNTIVLGVTGLRDPYFISLDYEFSIKDPVETDPQGLIMYSNEEINLSFGYSVNDWLGLFAGYRRGETDAKYTANNDSFGNNSKGFYIGSSANRYVEGAGSFGVSLAIAKLDGEISLSEPFVDTTKFNLVTPPDNIKGSALGFSLGLSWATTVSPNTLLGADIKIHRYEFEDDVVFAGRDLTYEENFTIFNIGLTHFFD